MHTRASGLSPSKRFKRGLSATVVNVVLGVFSLSCIFPVVWLFYSSVKTNREFGADIIGLPTAIHWDNYTYILEGGQVTTFLWNTVRNTAVSLFLIILFGFVVGYFVSRFDFRGRRVLYLLYLLGMLMPIHAIIVPIYILFLQVGLTNHWYTLVFPYVAFFLPMSIFLVESYIKSLPRELEEAASIDGAGFTRTMFTIIMPVAVPVLVTVGIIQFFNCWNEFIFGLILLNDEALLTIPVGMARFKGQFSANYPQMMTIMVLSILPAMAIYFAFSKRIIEGMVAGSVKG